MCKDEKNDKLKCECITGCGFVSSGSNLSDDEIECYCYEKKVCYKYNEETKKWKINKKASSEEKWKATGDEYENQNGLHFKSQSIN